MRAVLISIKPEWCRKIVSGEKTYEIRKSLPKQCKRAFKCYIYCTLGGLYDLSIRNDSTGKEYLANGYVIGEFICDKIYEVVHDDGYKLTTGSENEWNEVAFGSRLDYSQMREYLGDQMGYAWKISELQIYDEPQRLNNFRLSMPPHSWTYVTDVEYGGFHEKCR